MTKQEVISLMLNSKSEEDWNNNCDTVKAAHNGQYPSYWFLDIIMGGILNKSKKNWE